MIRRGYFTLILLVMISSLFAQEGKIFSITKGSINFRSEAPFELIKASSKDLVGLLDAGRKTFAFKVDMQSFQGFNSALQREHFNENYMESNTYPTASFGGKIIEDVDLTKDGDYTVRAKGNLIVHGVSQERIIKVDMNVKNNVVKIKSSFSVLLSDHNIPIPKVVKDKLAAEIKVDIAGQLAPK
jgi:hypothetical protein